METRTENETRLRPWPEDLTVENVAAWIFAQLQRLHPARCAPHSAGHD